MCQDIEIDRRKFVRLVETTLLRRGGSISLNGLLKILSARGYYVPSIPEALRGAGFKVDEAFGRVYLRGVRIDE